MTETNATDGGAQTDEHCESNVQPQNETDRPDNFAMETGSGAASRDSALQYVSFDICENGGDPDDQEALLEPLEAEIREHWGTVTREAVTIAFAHSPRRAAQFVTEEFRDRLTYEGVPEGYRDEVRTAFEKRLDQKEAQLADAYDDFVTDARRRGKALPEDAVVNWGSVL